MRPAIAAWWCGTTTTTATAATATVVGIGIEQFGGWCANAAIAPAASGWWPEAARLPAIEKGAVGQSCAAAHATITARGPSRAAEDAIALA